MSELKGMNYLKAMLAIKKPKNTVRYNYYEMHRLRKKCPLIPDLRFSEYFGSALGWCTKAVDSLADRLVFKEWQDDNFKISEIFQMNNPDIFFDSAITSALITSCAFVYISLGEDGYPRLEVVDGRYATGVVDPVTNLLKEGYAVLRRNEETPTLEAYFEPGRTTFYETGKEPYVVENSAQYPLLVPIIYRPDAKRPFGHSRISRACQELTDGAIRTTLRMETSSEFYSFPQKYVLGLSPDAERMDKWKATVTSFLQFDKDEDGDRPTLGQFQQQTMTPYLDVIKAYAAMFAGETGLTMDDLGFVSDNPSSAEAIKASHETLRLTARKAQRTFGACFLNVGYLAACLRDDFPYQRKQFYLTKPIWEPIFEPDAATLSGIGDGAIKINQAVPGYFNTDNLKLLTGIDCSRLEPPAAEGDNGTV